MTPEAQRIAIAEACGWKEGTTGLWKDPDRSGYYVLSNYLHDLNAMHEAEKVLKVRGLDFGLYGNALRKIVAIQETGYDWHATAAQRSQAFLRTLGLWKE